MLEITVIGTPAPQGSKSFKGVSKNGKPMFRESSDKVPVWREAVKHAAVEAMSRPDHIPDRPMIRGPVSLAIVFTLPKPKSAPKTRTIYPDRTPDLSKLIRCTEDALTDAGVWEDDARVVKCAAMKVYPNEGSGSLAVPGAFIRVRSFTSDGV